MGLKRRLARWIPALSQAAASLDRLEEENRQLHRALAELQRLHTREHPAPASGEEVGPDGLPIPPMPLQYWVTSHSDTHWFLELGRKAADTIVQVLARRGLALTDLRTVLDFGCGAGRVMRHLARYESLELHGTDYNRTAVAWCDEHLPFAQFGTNRLQPPTRYRAAAFDLVYAFSVFTHLTEPLQRLWMEELRRILRRGGHLILSLHGEACLTRLAVAEQNRFRRGELVVISAEQAGQNGCAAYHPERYVRDVLAADFDVLEFVPRGALGNPPQDVYLLRRRES